MSVQNADIDPYETYHVVSRNKEYTGETEGFAFSNGVAVVPGLPAGASEGRVALRRLRLGSLNNYYTFLRVRRQNGRTYTEQEQTYQILTPEEFALLFSEDDPDIDDYDEWEPGEVREAVDLESVR